MSTTKYWVAAISKEHTQRGMSGGFIQVETSNFWKAKRLRSSH